MNSFVKRSSLIVAAVASMLGAGLAAPASAASCPSGAICIWDGTGYSGPANAQVLGPDFVSGECTALTSDWDNRISSLINRSSRTLTFYDGAGCTGGSFTLPNMAQVANLGSFDNRISSIRV